MALYENLPVYKAAYDLLLETYRICSNVQRDYRYTLGEKLKQELIEIVVDVYKANSTVDKTEVLQDARQRVVVVKLQMRILRDLNQITVKAFALQSERAETLSKQLAAWHKYSLNKDKILKS